MHRLAFWAAASALACVAAGPSAAAPLPTQIGTNGFRDVDYSGSTDVLNDGAYPTDGTQYQTGTVHDFAAGIYFDFIFENAAKNVGSFNLTVDNNDDYTITFFNGSTVTATRVIGAAQGDVGDGVQTFSSDPSLSGFYLANLALATPVQATSVRIQASGGDSRYSIGEAEFFAAPAAAVPEPATWAALLIGFGGIGLATRRSLRRSEARFTAKVRRIAAGDQA